MGELYLGTTHFDPRLGLTAAELRPALSRSLTPKLAARWVSRLSANRRALACVILGRQFTHERLMAGSAIAAFEDGLAPLVAAQRLGALVMRFPPEFRFCRESRDHLIALRRAFHRYPLVVDAPHPSWEVSEARGVLIDYHLGSAGRDLPLTSGIGYARLGPNDDLAAVARRAQRVAAFADRVFLLADTAGRAIELKSLFGSDSVRPAQPAFEFERAVA